MRIIEFFTGFSSQTRGGVGPIPRVLTFTLKDAMPDRKSRNITLRDEEDFRWMRKFILKHFEKANEFLPGLKEFVVLISDPEWVPARKRLR